MIGSQYLMFCSDFGKFRELPIEGVFDKNECEGTNGSLPFFVLYNFIVMTVVRKLTIGGV